MCFGILPLVKHSHELFIYHFQWNMQLVSQRTQLVLLSQHLSAFASSAKVLLFQTCFTDVVDGECRLEPREQFARFAYTKTKVAAHRNSVAQYRGEQSFAKKRWRTSRHYKLANWNFWSEVTSSLLHTLDLVCKCSNLLQVIVRAGYERGRAKLISSCETQDVTNIRVGSTIHMRYNKTVKRDSLIT